MIQRLNKIEVNFTKCYTNIDLSVLSQNSCALSIDTVRSFKIEPQEAVQTILIQFVSKQSDQTKKQKGEEQNQNQNQSNKFKILRRTRCIDLLKNSHLNICNKKEQKKRALPQNQNFRNRFLFMKKQLKQVKEYNKNHSSQYRLIQRSQIYRKAVGLQNQDQYISIGDLGKTILYNKYPSQQNVGDHQGQSFFVYGFPRQSANYIKSIYNIDNRSLLFHAGDSRVNYEDLSGDKFGKLGLIDLEYGQCVRQWGRLGPKVINKGQFFNGHSILLSTNQFCSGIHDTEQNNHQLNLYDIRIKGKVQVISSSADQQIDRIIWAQFNRPAGNAFINYHYVENINLFCPFKLLTFIQSYSSMNFLPIVIDIRKPSHYHKLNCSWGQSFRAVKGLSFETNKQNPAQSRLWVVQRNPQTKQLIISKNKITL